MLNLTMTMESYKLEQTPGLKAVLPDANVNAKHRLQNWKGLVFVLIQETACPHFIETPGDFNGFTFISHPFL